MTSPLMCRKSAVPTLSGETLLSTKICILYDVVDILIGGVCEWETSLYGHVGVTFIQSTICQGNLTFTNILSGLPSF